MFTLESSTLGESPPPAPRACFGRDELIEKIIGLAEALTPVALIGSGGIGKTSIALTVLHHDRIKERFGDNRRFIRCDQFPASPANFLRRLSKVIGADVENSEDLIPLRPFLTSKEMLIVLDNAESILDPQGASGREINVFVEELSQINNICLCITSRITTVPPDCKTLEIPTLSMEAARDTFYRIYEYGGQSDSTNDILEQLDFHPLSVTLLATVAHQNKWDGNRLAKEWKQRQTGVLQTGYNKSLACAIELSLASPMFRELGPDARGLLGVAAFFPQGIDENNLDWLFPTISNRTAIFDTFCVLSLTYRNNEFVTMLAPLRDLLRPQDPMSSSLLCATKNRYFARMLIDFDRNSPVFKESQWIILEDVNVEHLLDVFTSVDGNSYEVWEACADFTNHIYWHKPRPTVLRQRMEGLPDDHPSKLGCLVELAKLFHSIGNNMERKRLLNHVLELQRGGDDENAVAYTLSSLSDANRTLGFYKEGIQQAREGFEIYQRVGTKAHQAGCLNYLALLLYADERPGEAKEAAFHVVGLLEEGEEYMACQSQRLLGDIYRFDGEREKAIHHLEVALRIASPFNWHNQLSHIHYALGWLFLDQGEFGNAHTHVEQAKLYAVENAYSLGRAMALEAQVWHRQGRLEEAGCEALRASEIFEKLGAAEESESCRDFLRYIEQVMRGQSASENLNPNGELLGWIFCPTPVDSPFLVHGSPSNAPAKFRFSSRFKQISIFF